MASQLDPELLLLFAELADTGEFHGPAILDQESVLKLAEQMGAGVVTFAQDAATIEATIEATPQEVFDGLFRGFLDAPILRSKLADVSTHRAMAIQQTVRHLLQHTTAKVVDVNPELSAESLDAWLAQAVFELPAHFTSEQRQVLGDHLFTVTPDELARLVGFTVGVLGVWRQRKQGPPYLLTGRGRISYPVAGVVRWLDQQQVSA